MRIVTPNAISSHPTAIPNPTTNDKRALKTPSLINISANKNVIAITGKTICEKILKTFPAMALNDKKMKAIAAVIATIPMINVISSSVV